MGNILGAPTGPAATAGGGLRAAAGEQAQLRNAAFERSRAAYASGDHVAARSWSEQGRRHGARMKALNAQAAQAVFDANNAGRAPDEVDLHGLHVGEALKLADIAVTSARARGARKLVLIVGRGLHSPDGVARLRPAVERALMTKHSLRITPGVPNAGCLLVELVQPSEAGWLERVVNACVIC
ncbi:MAG: hypothetical protein J3K34DRAFT_423113 [Monoraphidium minutum]|nr:MAG: hypothetical protein J3K34DRAFT_423113 [Monoraphidium minutum]